jgi:hypothetical protein
VRLQRGQRDLPALDIAGDAGERIPDRRAEGGGGDGAFTGEPVLRDVVPGAPERARGQAGGGVGRLPHLAPVAPQHAAVVEDHRLDRAPGPIGNGGAHLRCLAGGRIALRHRL